MSPRTRPPRYIIRHVAGPDYAEVIGKLLAESFGTAELGPTAFIGTSWWLAFHVQPSGEEIAVGVAGMLKSCIEADTYYLNRSCIQADHRGRGLQHKLILSRIAEARRLKGKFCTADTWDNPHSANNLIACGFRAYRPEATAWRCEGAMYWRLSLAKAPTRMVKL